MTTWTRTYSDATVIGEGNMIRVALKCPCGMTMHATMIDYQDKLILECGCGTYFELELTEPEL